MYDKVTKFEKHPVNHYCNMRRQNTYKLNTLDISLIIYSHPLTKNHLKSKCKIMLTQTDIFI